jgi:hypothetical protein
MTTQLSRKERKAANAAKRMEMADKAQYLHTHDVRPKKGPNNISSRFIRYLDPIERDLAEVEYEHVLLEPEEAEMVGVPLAVGGVAPTSMKVRCRQRTSFVADNGGRACFSVFNCSAPQGAVLVEDPGDENVDFIREANRNNRLAWLNTGGNVVRQPIVAGSLFGGASPGYGEPIPTIPGNVFIPAFNPQLALANTLGRVVAQEFRVFPTDSVLLTKGTGTIVQATTNGDVGLNGKTFAQVYDLQSVELTTLSLTNWRPGEKFAANRFPLQVEDVNWMPTYAPDDSHRVPFNEAGTIWASFYADGCSPNQSFGVELITVYEFRNNAFPFGTPNMTTSASLELTSSLRTDHGAVAGTPSELHLHRIASLAASRARQMGVKHAGGFMDWLKDSAVPALGRAASSLLPKIGGLALSMLSEGTIPPSISIPALEAGVQMFHPLSGLKTIEREAPSPPRIEEVPDDYEIEEPDVLILRRSQAPGTSSTKRIGVAPKATAPLNNPQQKEGFEEKVRVSVPDIEECPSCNCLH